MIVHALHSVAAEALTVSVLEPHWRPKADASGTRRQLGDLWASASNGHCLFVMPKGNDLNAIKQKIAEPLPSCSSP